MAFQVPTNIRRKQILILLAYYSVCAMGMIAFLVFLEYLKEYRILLFCACWSAICLFDSFLYLRVRNDWKYVCMVSGMGLWILLGILVPVFHLSVYWIFGSTFLLLVFSSVLMSRLRARIIGNILLHLCDKPVEADQSFESQEMSDEDFRRFARLLGARALVIDYAIFSSGCIYYMPLLKSTISFVSPMPVWLNGSTVFIDRKGSVQVHVSERDLYKLRRNTTRTDLEKKASLLFERVLHFFKQGEPDKARKTIEDSLDKQVLANAKNKTRKLNLSVFAFIFVVILMAVLVSILRK